MPWQAARERRAMEQARDPDTAWLFLWQHLRTARLSPFLAIVDKERSDPQKSTWFQIKISSW